MNLRRRFLLPHPQVRQARSSHYVQATHVALASLRVPLDFDSLQEFEFHLQEKYGSFRWDQIWRILDFRRKTDNISRTMYTRLARLSRESKGVFTES